MRICWRSWAGEGREVEMIGLTCEICGERFDVAVHEGPQRDIEAADWVAAHACGGRILADDGEVIRRAFALGDIRKAVRRIRVSGRLK